MQSSVRPQLYNILNLLPTFMLFSTRTLTWISRTSPTRVLIGLTQRGLDNLGSIKKIEYNIPPPTSPTSITNTVVAREQNPLLTFHWEGYKTTFADELYHAVWDSVEGTHSLASPLTGSLIEYNDEKELYCLEANDWIYSLELEERNSEEFLQLVDEHTYKKYVSNLEPGLFYEDEES